jgi:predicted porin
MNNLMLDNIPGYDPVNAQMFSPINFSGSYGGGGLTDNGRADNAIKYTKNVLGVTVNALYGFGGMSNNNTTRSQEQIGLGYETNRYGVQGVYEIVHDATAISYNAPNSVKATFSDLRSSQVTARYTVLDNLTLKAGWENRNFGTPSNFAADQTLPSIYGYSIGAYASGVTKTDNTYWAGANYSANPTSKVSVGYYTTRTNPYGTTAANTVNYVSALYDYYFSKRTNLYVGVMNATKTGVDPTVDHTTWWTYGAGMVHQF